MQLNPQNISDQAASAVRNMIVEGLLADGERINEVRLAQTLGVSRTPLREGLGRLVAEGIVTTQSRRGFFVAPLTLTEFQHVYDIRPLLDPPALKLAGIPSPTRLATLHQLNTDMQRASTASQAIDLDNTWHRTLIETCPNTVLLTLIDQFIDRTRRYEYALFRETTNVFTAGDEHERILHALGDNDLGSACTLLENNLRGGAPAIVNWLTLRQTQVGNH
ncbi:MAG: GntR family transcriptional regulator [Pseudomonadota bacterium]